MNITKDTKIKDILQEYPWLKDEAMKISDRAKLIDTPFGRMLLRKATIADVSQKTGVSEEEIIAIIHSFIDGHER